jgi:hypothetical protein
MSNIPDPIVVDATGAGDNVVLPLGTGPYVRTVGGVTRLVVHDGMTPGGFPHATKPEVDAKPDRFPTTPASVVQVNYDNLFTAFRLRFYDDTNKRLIPTRALGSPNSGCPDPTLPDASGNKLSPWQWSIGMRALVDRYDLTQTATAKARVLGAWTYFQTQYTQAQMVNPIYGQNPTTGLFDDSMWFAHALYDIYRITGDANAFSILLDYIAANYQMYRDTRSTNPIIDYGVSSPNGTPFKRNKLGLQYQPNQGNGDCSQIFEVMMAIVLWEVSQLPVAGPLTAAYKAALYQAAKDTWAWGLTMKFAGSATAQAGIYVGQINLAPGSNPGSQHITDGTTRRGLSSLSDNGTLAMGILSDMLATTETDPKYLAEFQSVANAYPVQTLGYGRSWKGLPCLVNSRDPWTNGFFHVQFTRRLLARYPNPNDYSAYKLAVLGASKVIAPQSTDDGVISPEWGPPELGPYPNSYTWTQDSMAGYGGTDGGGQATGRQIMTAASSMGVIAAASLLASSEAALGSGMLAGGIEILTGLIAASLIASPAAKIYWMEQWGRYKRQWNTNNNSLQESIGEVNLRDLSATAMDLFVDLYAHKHFYCTGGIDTAGDVQAHTGDAGGQLYMGLMGAGRGINLGFNGFSISSDGNHVAVHVNGTEVFRVDSGGIASYQAISFMQNGQQKILSVDSNGFVRA